MCLNNRKIFGDVILERGILTIALLRLIQRDRRLIIIDLIPQIGCIERDPG